VLSELRQRGVQDILVLCADGLKGLPEAVEAAFPQTIFQTCLVHMVRSSTRFVPWKERKALCADLKLIYGAKNLDAAELALLEFEEKWGQRYPMRDPTATPFSCLGGDLLLTRRFTGIHGDLAG